MARQRRSRRRAGRATGEPTPRRPFDGPISAVPAAGRTTWPLIGLGLVLGLVALVGGFALLNGPLAGTASGPADDGRGAVIVQGERGSWSEITVDELDAKMAAEEVTLLNVKTPYVGEIEGTDLYIPYDQLVARADELPADKSAELIVYCRTGNQSGIAAQILVDLGYTNVVNVDGGMVAWTGSGRELIEVDRS
jgi:phage shock protein E